MKNHPFIDRFIEVCGSDEPTEIKQLLNISYQAAKNYLSGRLPNAATLIKIADRTHCSIDWLLTGRGEKFVGRDPNLNTPIPSRQFEESVRRICVQVINDVNSGSRPEASKVVVLKADDLLSEKETVETESSPAAYVKENS